MFEPLTTKQFDTLYAEDRDSGEWESFDNFTSNHIRLVDNSYKQTKYKGDGE